MRKQEAAEDASAAFDQSVQALEQAISACNEIEETWGPLATAQTEAKLRLNTNKQELVEAQSAQRDIRGHLDVARSSVTRLKTSMDTERQRLEAADGGSQAARLAAIEEAEAAAIEAKRVFEEHQTTLAQLDLDRRTTTTKAKDFQLEVDRQIREVDAATVKLSGLQHNQSDIFAGFPNTLPSLLRTIANDNRFQEKPVGPLGLHMTLLKPEWSSIIEKTFGGALSSFVVTSKQDQRLLSDILQRTRK